MDRSEFSEIRRQLGKTQAQMAQMLSISHKAIQSFEQGWRKIPTHIERQALLLLALKSRNLNKGQLCWISQKCPPERRDNCPAWELKAGHMCWIINGTICHGKTQGSWSKKIYLCKKCQVYLSAFA
jgi:DNA-binding XRE family transcriptional regulator